MESKRRSKKINNSPSTNLMKPRRKRSHSRKTLSNCLINFAEARREIANALQYHHRRSLSPPKNHFSSPLVDGDIGSFSTKSPKFSSPEKAQTQRDIGPTRAKSETPVVAGPTPIWEVLDFGDVESNFAASYSWWVGFLESLDGKNHQESSKPVISNGAEALGQAHDSCDDGSGSSSSSSLDEWLEILNPDVDHDVVCGLISL